MEHNVTLTAGTWTIRGQRLHNEDFCLQDPDRQLYVLADGVGGAPYGDIMARICCYAALDLWDGDCSRSLEARLRSLVAALAEATAQTSRWLGDNGSSSTLLFCVIEGERAGIASVGDSMAYLVRTDSCQQLVSDDRLAEGSHVITQALGLNRPIEPSLSVGNLADGERLVLCSDGVWEQLAPDDLVSLCADPTIDETTLAQRLCQLADGSDNATALVIGAHAIEGEIVPDAAPSDGPEGAAPEECNTAPQADRQDESPNPDADPTS